MFWRCVLDLRGLFATDWCGCSAIHQIMASLSGFFQGQTQINVLLPVGCLRPTAAADPGVQSEPRIQTVPCELEINQQL